MRNENSGGDVNYYQVKVTHPKRTEPYVAECEDIIAHLGMDFFEGEAFKAAWRKAAQRTLGVGKEGNTALRDAQKMAHYGARCLAIEGYRLTYPDPEVPLEETPVAQVPPVHCWQKGDVVRNVGGGDHWIVGTEYRVLGVGHGTVRVSHEGVVPHWMVFSVADLRFQWVRSGD